MPIDVLSALENGQGHLADTHQSVELSKVPTEGTAVASSPTEGTSQKASINSTLLRIGRIASNIHLPRLAANQTGLRVNGAMKDISIPKRPCCFDSNATVEEYPIGFPRLSCFLDSDDAFMVYKRFGITFSRLLLHKQDEIRRMEADLRGMDKLDVRNGHGNFLMSTYEDGRRDQETIPACWSTTRPQLLQRLETKVLEYLLLSYGSGFSASTPEQASLADITQETRARTGDKHIHYYDRRRISKCVTFLITILILFLLMVPIWLLYNAAVHNTIGKTSDTIVLILAFTLIFSAALSAFTKAKRHEIVAASAG
ncbi:MAG: hypothetical protein Q9222_004158 [Ikaeria aurantiellina]